LVHSRGHLESMVAIVCTKSQCEYTIEDLFDLVFPEAAGYLCMVVNCFLDDSKDQNQSKLIVSAGFFGTKEDWGQLRIAWSRRLKEDGIRYFKTSEYKMLEEEFAKFKTAAYPAPTGRQKAKEIRDSLRGILREHPRIRGVGVAIAIEDYNKVCARPEAQGVLIGSPYHRALDSVMFETVKLIRKIPGHHKVAFVHDDGPDFDDLRKVYTAFKANNPKTAKSLAGFQPLNDKEHPPLQAADMLANYALGIGIEWLTAGRSAAKVREMRENLTLLGVWDEHYLLSVLKRNLPRHGKPIPLDLQSKEYGD
jgi:Protein of unknown function (DUF3800)